MLLVKDSSRGVAVMIYYITMIELWQEWQTSKITIKIIIFHRKIGHLFGSDGSLRQLLPI